MARSAGATGRRDRDDAEVLRGVVGPRRRSLLGRLLHRLGRALFGLVVVTTGALLLAVALLAVADPPTTPYMWSEGRRLGGIEQEWVPIGAIAPDLARAAVAAEDAGFCRHWGLDVEAIRAALADGAGRGGSTISQQVVKNVFLWPGRSWARKALEAMITPVMELILPKRRILEIYLNVAEWGEGTFGAEAAARRHFGVAAADLTPAQAAALAAALPAPKSRDPAALTEALRARAASIADGAATIARDGRAVCFEGAR